MYIFFPTIKDVYVFYVLKHLELEKGANRPIIAPLVTARNSSPQQKDTNRFKGSEKKKRF